MRNTYLSRLYRYDRKLFFFIVAFAGLTVICNLLGKETTPFFVWGMYSEKFKLSDNYEIFRTTINDSVSVDASSGYSDNTRAFLNAPLAYYRKIKEGGIDPVIPFLKSKLGARYSWIVPFEKKLFNQYNQHDFMNWYRCYLERVTGIKIQRIRVDILKTKFGEEQHLVLDSTYLFEAWKQH